MYGLLGESRKTLGKREDLPTEAAVQLNYNPIPSTLLGLFDGRLTNLPEHRLVGQLEVRDVANLLSHVTIWCSVLLSINRESPHRR